MPQIYAYCFFSFLSIIIIIIVIIIIIIVMCSLRVQAEKCVRFPQGSSLVLCLCFRIFYFCFVEL